MNAHFRAFSFVDRIESGRPGVDIRGHYTVPATLPEFPASLVAESVGQLAAWSTLSANGFARRPMAGIAGRIELMAGVRPGQLLDLAAEIEHLDETAVTYRGTASVHGTPVLRLHDCIGPMLETGEFDDPIALRERFRILYETGVAAGGFGGLPDFALERSRHEPGKNLAAGFRVPGDAAFFLDHFPRRPVFPGSLLMHLNLDLAELLAADIPAPPPAEKWAATIVEDVKLRAFIPPGESLELEARVLDIAPMALTIGVETRRTGPGNGGRSSGSARVRLSGWPR